MSTFCCEECGIICFDTPIGYITGCKHWKPDIVKCECGHDFDKHVYETVTAQGARLSCKMPCHACNCKDFKGNIHS
jgi:hypothetical protein